MGQRLTVHPVTPQGRFLDRAAETLADRGVVILPTDTCYAFVALPSAKAALERIARIKEIDSDRKLFSLIVPDLAGVAKYAVVDNSNYRLLRHYLPGPYTFVLPATREAPKILGARRKTIGLRVPDHDVVRGVAARTDGVLFASTVKLPGDDLPLVDPDDIADRLLKQVDVFLDQGVGGVEASTVVDLTGDEPVILRAGAGDPAAFGG